MGKQKHSILTYVLFFMAVMQFIAIVHLNYSHAYGLLNMDASIGIRQNIEQWKYGLFLEDFNATTNLSNDCVCFFTMPLFLLTGNLGLAMAAGQVLAYAIIVFVLRDICLNVKASVEQFLFSVLVIFTPYSIDILDWAYMLFVSVGYWEYRVITLLLLMDLLLMCEQPKVNKAKLAVVLLGYCFLNFWTSISTGNYILCMVVLPFTLKVIWDIIYRQKFSWKSKENWIILISCIVSVCGWAYRMMNASATGRNNNDLSLIPADGFFDNLFNAITGVFLLFGGLVSSDKISVFSSIGIVVLIRLAFLVIGLVFVVIECCRKKCRDRLIRSFLCVVAVNMAVLLVTNTSYGSGIFEYRYHMLWSVAFLLVLASIVMNPSFQNKWLNNCIRYGFVCALVLINLAGYYSLYHSGDGGYEKAIVQVAEERAVDSIFIYNNPSIASNLRVIDMEKNSSSVTYEPGYMAIHEWGYYDFCADNDGTNTPNILICQDTQFQAMPAYVRDEYILVDTETFGRGHNVYYAERSPWDYRCGVPTSDRTTSVDFPYTKGYIFMGGIDEEGSLIAGQDNEGYVLCSPNCSTKAGRYNVTVVYEILEAGEEGPMAVLDIATDNGETSLIRAEMPEEGTSFTIENIDITADVELKFRIWKSESSVLSIQKLIFERVEQ